MSSQVGHGSLRGTLHGVGLPHQGLQVPAAAPKHVVQGVTVEISRRGVTVSPTPERVRRIMDQIQKALGADSLKPDEAKLAGRLSSSARRSSAGSGRPPLRRSTPERRTRQTPLHPLLPRRHGRGGALRGRLLPGRREDTQGGSRRRRTLQAQPCQQRLGLRPAARRRSVLRPRRRPSLVSPEVRLPAGLHLHARDLRADGGFRGVLRRRPMWPTHADAVSRDDFSRARREGWTKVHTPASEIMHILARAVETWPTRWMLRRTTCSPALPLGLLSRRVVGQGAPGGADMRTRRRL